MIDTFAISKTFARPPDENNLFAKGWKVLYKPDGDFSRLILNSEKGSGEPRLTIFPNHKGLWILKAEVSLFSWLYGSNINLPDEIEFNSGLKLLSEFVEEKSEISFNAQIERVSRVDFARNFKVEEKSILPIISTFSKMEIPKYVCEPRKTSVYFRNSGKVKNKHFLIYSKLHQVINEGKSIDEQEKAKGIIRLEVSHKNKAIYNLAKSLELPNRNAGSVLTSEISETVIETTMNLLQFRAVINGEFNQVENLFRMYGVKNARNLVAFLAFRRIYGNELYKVSFLDYSKRTCQKYLKECRNAGVLSIE